MLHERLAQGRAEFPNMPCIIEAETGRTLTYAECAAAVAALRRLVGAEPRTLIMALPSGTTGALIWLCALTGGHTLLPLPPDAGAAERRRAVQLAAPDLLLVDRAEHAEGFARPQARILTRQECEHTVEAAINRANAAGATSGQFDLPARAGRVCLMTSGSTGEPKGVFLTEPQIAWTADHIRQSHRLSASDRGLTVLPLFHVNAPVVSLCSSILAGGTVVIARRFSRTRFWDWVERYRITWASLVPTILAMLLETERPAFLPGALRFVRTASAPLPVVHLRAFEQRFGVPVIETYGLSEAAATVSANPVPPGRHKPGSVGLPVGVDLRVCRSRRGAEPEPLVDVAPGESGEICVRGPSVIAAYAGGASAAVFQDGWFRTGDLGYQDADGYLYITGRQRDVIIRGGENIAPREIEEVLLADPLLRDVAIVGQPDPLYGQQVVAYVVAKAKWSEELERAVRERCAASLSPYKVPQTFVPVAKLPRTRSGKIQRHRLAALSALSGLSGISLVAAMLSGSRVGQSVAEGVTATVASTASTVTSTLARIRRVQRAHASRGLERPVKLAVESSPHHYIVRVTTPQPVVTSGAPPMRQGIRPPGTGAETVPLAVVHVASASMPRESNGLPIANGHGDAAVVVGGGGARGRLAPAPMNGIAREVGAAAAETATAGAVPAQKRAGRRPYVHELDPIRIVTALAVVGVHVLTFSMVLNSTALGGAIQLGAGSALHFTREIFMFTTAFVLVYSYAGTRFSLTTFARKRGIGVVVPYVLWSLIYFWLNRPLQPPAQYTLALAKAVLSGNASYQLYYILLTIQFYMLFPVLLLVLPWIRRHQRAVLVASCALELVVLAIDYLYVQTPPIVTTPWGSLLDYYQDRFVLVYQFYFILGAVVAINFDRVRATMARHGRLIVAAMLLALGLFWMNFALGVWWLHQSVEYATSVLQPELVPYSLAVLALLGWLACRWAAQRGPDGTPWGASVWRTLADSAFGIYLVHPIFLSLALYTVVPALPTALPVALRVGLLWVLVGGASTGCSILLMKTPILSRLVGRAAPVPSPDAIQGAIMARVRGAAPVAQTGLSGDARHPVPVGERATQPPMHRSMGDPTVAASRPPVATDAAGSGAIQLPTRPAGSSGRIVRPPVPDLPAWVSASRFTNPRVVRVRLDDWTRVTRPLPVVEPGRITTNLRDGAPEQKEDADALIEGGVEQAADSRGLRDERRRRAWELRQEGWKQKDIAAELGVSQSTVSGWLRRERDEETTAPDVMRDENTDEVGSVPGAPGAPSVRRAAMTSGRLRA